MKTVNLSGCGIILLFMISSIHGQIANICSGIRNAVFLPNFESCQNYYVCMNEYAYPLSCPSGYLFDTLNQMCNNPGSMQCVSCSKNTGLSFISLGGTCTRYVLCAEQTASYQSCWDGLMYNKATKKCDFPSNVTCTESRAASCSSYPRDTVTYVASPDNCAEYTICINGKGYAQTCTAGLNFNPNKNSCVTQKSYSCTKPTSRHARSLPLESDKIDFVERPGIGCPRHGTHFVGNQHSCSDYFFCMNGYSALLTCTDGLHYDSKTQTCRLPELADCKGS